MKDLVQELFDAAEKWTHDEDSPPATLETFVEAFAEALANVTVLAAASIARVPDNAAIIRGLEVARTGVGEFFSHVYATITGEMIEDIKSGDFKPFDILDAEPTNEAPETKQ